MTALQRGPTGAAAPPRRVACARLALEWLLVPTLAAGLCLPAAVCCSSLPCAALSVGRVEAVRAVQARAGGGGARPRTDLRRGAVPPRGAIDGVAQSAAASGGEAAAPLSRATAEAPSSRPHKPPSPPDVAVPRRHTHASLAPDAVVIRCAGAAMARAAWMGRCAERIWRFIRRRFITRRQLRRAPGPRADAGGAGDSAARGWAGRRGARRGALCGAGDDAPRHRAGGRGSGGGGGRWRRRTGGGRGEGAGGTREHQKLPTRCSHFAIPPNFPSFPPFVSRVPSSSSRSLSFASRRFSKNFGVVLACRWRRPQSAARLGHGGLRLLRCLLPQLRKSQPSMRWSRNA